MFSHMRKIVSTPDQNSITTILQALELAIVPDRLSLLAGQAINLIVLRGHVTDETVGLNLV